MLRIPHSLNTALINSGIKRKELEGKKAMLVDARKFLQEINKETEKVSKENDIVTALGLMTWAVSMVCDAIVDAVTGGGPQSKTPQMMLIRKAYDVGTKNKFDNNAFKKHADAVKKAQDALKKALPKDLGFLADVFGNLGRNTIGMIGYATDAEETKKSLRQALTIGRDGLKRLDQEIARIDKALGELPATEPATRNEGPRLAPLR